MSFLVPSMRSRAHCGQHSFGAHRLRVVLTGSRARTTRSRGATPSSSTDLRISENALARKTDQEGLQPPHERPANDKFRTLDKTLTVELAVPFCGQNCPHVSLDKYQLEPHCVHAGPDQRCWNGLRLHRRSSSLQVPVARL